MIEVSGLPAVIALLVPFAVLLIVILYARRSVAPTPAPAPQTALETEMFRAVPAGGALAPATAAAPPLARETAHPPSKHELAARIAEAEAANDHGAVAGLYLDYARVELADGRTEAAAGHLRASIRAAIGSRNAAAQAEARLELAELARAAGDLTTACEHWQIARSLFHGLGAVAHLGETERLMREHHCPTDWVLNDF